MTPMPNPFAILTRRNDRQWRDGLATHWRRANEEGSQRDHRRRRRRSNAGRHIERTRASSHREALAILNEPCADNTDTFAWVSDATHDKLYLIMDFNPLHEPGQGNQGLRACNGYRYEFHIAKGKSLKERLDLPRRVHQSSVGGTVAERQPIRSAAATSCSGS